MRHISITRRRSPRPVGMVSILVTMILMIVISLIVLGFAQISRREQRQALDRQLSTQAFFAAESGVNDARKVIAARAALGLPAEEKDSCGKQGNYQAEPIIDNANDTDPSNDVVYTCLLVTTRLKNINVNVGAFGKSVAVPLEPDGAPMTELRVNWKSTRTGLTQPDVAGNCNQHPAFLQNGIGKWTCPFGVLRMDIVPTDTFNRAAFSADQHTIFFYPTPGSNGVTDWRQANGAVAKMKCSATAGCDAVVDSIPSGNYMIRLSSIYQQGTADLTAYSADGTQLELRGAQIQVDSTGKAQDVLRRIQVRLPMVDPTPAPSFAIQSGSSICKRFEIDAANFKITGTERQDQNNPMCKPLKIEPPCVKPPIDLALILDASQSMNAPWGPQPPVGIIDRLTQEKTVAKRFIDQLKVSATGNHVAVQPFNSEPPANGDISPRTELSFNEPELFAAVDGMQMSCCTDYFVGLDYAAKVLAASTRPAVEKYVVFISDGQPTDGQKLIPPLPQSFYIDPRVAALKAQGYTIFTIAISEEAQGADRWLEPMAGGTSATGTTGTFVYAQDTADLDAAIDAIIGELACKKP